MLINLNTNPLTLSYVPNIRQMYRYILCNNGHQVSDSSGCLPFFREKDAIRWATENGYTVNPIVIPYEELSMIPSGLPCKMIKYTETQSGEPMKIQLTPALLSIDPTLFLLSESASINDRVAVKGNGDEWYIGHITKIDSGKKKFAVKYIDGDIREYSTKELNDPLYVQRVSNLAVKEWYKTAALKKYLVDDEPPTAVREGEKVVKVPKVKANITQLDLLAEQAIHVIKNVDNIKGNQTTIRAYLHKLDEKEIKLIATKLGLDNDGSKDSIVLNIARTVAPKPRITVGNEPSIHPMLNKRVAVVANDPNDWYTAQITAIDIAKGKFTVRYYDDGSQSTLPLNELVDTTLVKPIPDTITGVFYKKAELTRLLNSATVKQVVTTVKQTASIVKPDDGYTPFSDTDAKYLATQYEDTLLRTDNGSTKATVKPTLRVDVRGALDRAVDIMKGEYLEKTPYEALQLLSTAIEGFKQQPESESNTLWIRQTKQLIDYYKHLNTIDTDGYISSLKDASGNIVYKNDRHALPSEVLSKACMQRRDISGTVLRNKDLSGINLHNCILRNVDLSGSNLSNARLVYTKFLKCNLDNVKFDSATIDTTDFKGSSVKNVVFSKVQQDSALNLKVKEVGASDFNKVFPQPIINKDNAHEAQAMATRNRVMSKAHAFFIGISLNDKGSQKSALNQFENIITQDLKKYGINGVRPKVLADTLFPSFLNAHTNRKGELKQGLDLSGSEKEAVITQIAKNVRDNYPALNPLTGDPGELTLAISTELQAYMYLNVINYRKFARTEQDPFVVSVTKLLKEGEVNDGKIGGSTKTSNTYSVDTQSKLVKPTKEQILKAVQSVVPFLGSAQTRTLKQAMRGEERSWFETRMVEISNILKTLPDLGKTDGQGDSVMMQLHYFTSGADWYISELDTTTLNAFGWVDLGYGGELGYISIKELLKNSAELDLHFEPTSLGSIKKKSNVNKTDKNAVAVDNIRTALTFRGLRKPQKEFLNSLLTRIDGKFVYLTDDEFAEYNDIRPIIPAGSGVKTPTFLKNNPDTFLYGKDLEESTTPTTAVQDLLSGINPLKFALGSNANAILSGASTFSIAQPEYNRTVTYRFIPSSNSFELVASNGQHFGSDFTASKVMSDIQEAREKGFTTIGIGGKYTPSKDELIDPYDLPDDSQIVDMQQEVKKEPALTDLATSIMDKHPQTGNRIDVDIQQLPNNKFAVFNNNLHYTGRVFERAFNTKEQALIYTEKRVAYAHYIHLKENFDKISKVKYALITELKPSDFNVGDSVAIERYVNGKASKPVTNIRKVESVKPNTVVLDGKQWRMFDLQSQRLYIIHGDKSSEVKVHGESFYTELVSRHKERLRRDSDVIKKYEIDNPQYVSNHNVTESSLDTMSRTDAHSLVNLDIDTAVVKRFITLQQAQWKRDGLTNVPLLDKNKILTQVLSNQFKPNSELWKSATSVIEQLRKSGYVIQPIGGIHKGKYITNRSIYDNIVEKTDVVTLEEKHHVNPFYAKTTVEELEKGLNTLKAEKLVAEKKADKELQDSIRTGVVKKRKANMASPASTAFDLGISIDNLTSYIRDRKHTALPSKVKSSVVKTVAEPSVKPIVENNKTVSGLLGHNESANVWENRNVNGFKNAVDVAAMVLPKEWFNTVTNRYILFDEDKRSNAPTINVYSYASGSKTLIGSVKFGTAGNFYVYNLLKQDYKPRFTDFVHKVQEIWSVYTARQLKELSVKDMAELNSAMSSINQSITLYDVLQHVSIKTDTGEAICSSFNTAQQHLRDLLNKNQGADSSLVTLSFTLGSKRDPSMARTFSFPLNISTNGLVYNPFSKNLSSSIDFYSKTGNDSDYVVLLTTEPPLPDAVPQNKQEVVFKGFNTEFDLIHSVVRSKHILAVWTQFNRNGLRKKLDEDLKYVGYDCVLTADDVLVPNQYHATVIFNGVGKGSVVLTPTTPTELYSVYADSTTNALERDTIITRLKVVAQLLLRNVVKAAIMEKLYKEPISKYKEEYLKSLNLSETARRQLSIWLEGNDFTDNGLKTEEDWSRIDKRGYCKELERKAISEGRDFNEKFIDLAEKAANDFGISTNIILSKIAAKPTDTSIVTWDSQGNIKHLTIDFSKLSFSDRTRVITAFNYVLEKNRSDYVRVTELENVERNLSSEIGYTYGTGLAQTQHMRIVLGEDHDNVLAARLSSTFMELDHMLYTHVALALNKAGIDIKKALYGRDVFDELEVLKDPEDYSANTYSNSHIAISRIQKNHEMARRNLLRTDGKYNQFNLVESNESTLQVGDMVSLTKGTTSVIGRVVMKQARKMIQLSNTYKLADPDSKTYSIGSRNEFVSVSKHWRKMTAEERANFSPTFNRVG